MTVIATPTCTREDFVIGRELRSYIIEQQLRVAHETSIVAPTVALPHV
jgi:hypothetical protein